MPRGRAGLTAFGSVGVLVKASKKPPYNLAAVPNLAVDFLAEHSEVLAQIHERGQLVVHSKGDAGRRFRDLRDGRQSRNRPRFASVDGYAVRSPLSDIGDVGEGNTRKF